MMNFSKIAIIFLFINVAGAVSAQQPVSSDSLTTAQQEHYNLQEQAMIFLRRLFGSRRVAKEWFSADFSNQVSPSQAEKIIGEIIKKY